MSCNSEDVNSMKALINDLDLEKDTNFIAKGCNENYKTCKSCSWGDRDSKGGSYDFDDYNLVNLTINGYLEGKIPTSLTKFNNITSFDLSYNNFKGDLPSELNQFKGLNNFLNMDENQIDNIPLDKFPNLYKSLRYLSLVDNHFKGDLPSELNQFKGLNTLYMDKNQIDNIPLDKFPNLYKSVEILSLVDNNFKGELPKSLYQFNKLKDLSIGGYLNSIPSTGIENLNSLTSLYLEENKFTGEMPTELNQFSKLQYLYFGNNNLTSIPSNKLYNLKGLTRLRAYSNCISFTPQTANSFKNNFKNAIKNPFQMLDYNCISKGQYEIPGITSANCNTCNGCPLAKQKVIDKINIQNSHLTISYTQYNKGLCDNGE